MEQQRRRVAAREPFDAPEQHGVVALLVARVGAAFEGGHALAQAGAAVASRVEIALEALELVRRRLGEVPGQLALRSGQHAEVEGSRRQEGVGAARVVADAPEQQGRVQRDGREGVDGHAFAFAVGRGGGDEAHTGGKSAQRLPQRARIDRVGRVAGDEGPGVHGAVLLSILPFGLQAQQVLANHRRHRVPVQADVAGDRVRIAPHALDGLVQRQAGAAHAGEHGLHGIARQARGEGVVAPVADAPGDIDGLAVHGHLLDLRGVAVDQQPRRVHAGRGFGQPRLHGEEFAQPVAAARDRAARHAHARQFDQRVHRALGRAQDRRGQAHRYG